MDSIFGNPVDWNAISAISAACATIVALGIATGDSVRRLLARKTKSRTIAQWIIPHVITIEANIRRALIDFGRPEEVKDSNVYGITEAAFDQDLIDDSMRRRAMKFYRERLMLPELEKIQFELDCFKSAVRADFMALRSDLHLMASMIDIIENGSGDPDVVRDAMKQVRELLVSALERCWDAKAGLFVASRSNFAIRAWSRHARRRNKSRAIKMGVPFN